MDTVHVFISTGRFRSLEAMRQFIGPTYTEDGDARPSEFMREVGLSGYEPGCIEAIHSERPRTLPDLLAGASYSDQWVRSLGETRRADAAICVFSPNRVEHPGSGSWSTSARSGIAWFIQNGLSGWSTARAKKANVVVPEKRLVAPDHCTAGSASHSDIDQT